MKKIIVILTIVAVLFLSGCDNKYNDGFSEGYTAGYEAGYNEGYNKAASDYEKQISSYEGQISSYEGQIASYEDQIVKEEAQTYILNKSSKKFHKPSCSSVEKMKESNKVERIATRSELMEEGYSPCQSCKP